MQRGHSLKYNFTWNPPLLDNHVTTFNSRKTIGMQKEIFLQIVKAMRKYIRENRMNLTRGSVTGMPKFEHGDEFCYDYRAQNLQCEAQMKKTSRPTRRWDPVRQSTVQEQDYMDINIMRARVQFNPIRYQRSLYRNTLDWDRELDKKLRIRADNYLYPELIGMDPIEMQQENFRSFAQFQRLNHYITWKVLYNEGLKHEFEDWIYFFDQNTIKKVEVAQDFKVEGHHSYAVLKELMKWFFHNGSELARELGFMMNWLDHPQMQSKSMILKFYNNAGKIKFYAKSKDYLRYEVILNYTNIKRKMNRAQWDDYVNVDQRYQGGTIWERMVKPMLKIIDVEGILNNEIEINDDLLEVMINQGFFRDEQEREFWNKIHTQGYVKKNEVPWYYLRDDEKKQDRRKIVEGFRIGKDHIYRLKPELYRDHPAIEPGDIEVYETDYGE